jgi:1-acyl-sn-glycerol-3-phosphate acyltransferase
VYQRPLLSRAWYRLLQYTLQVVGIVYFRTRYSGRENIPAEGGVLVVSNHQSHLDPPLVGVGCPRIMNYLARDTLFKFAPFGRLIHSVGAIPIDREGVGLSGIKEALKRLKRGEMVLIFPEGTRTRDGQIAPFRPGFTALAVRSKAAILPVAIDGAFAAFPRTSKWPRPGRIRVHYGKPILPAEYAELNERELLAEVERRVRECHAQVKASAIKPAS